MAGNKIAGLTIEIGGETTGLSKALGGVNKTSKDLQSELKQVERLLKLDPTNTELLAQKQKILSESVANTSKKLDALKEAERQAQEQFKQGKISEEQYRALQREVIKTEQELNKLESQGEKVNAVLSKEDAAKNLKNIAFAAGAAAVAVGAAAIKLGSEFETAIAKVSTIADATEIPLKDLEKQILELSTQTGISADEIANNVYDAISAGQKTGDAVNFVTNSTKLAKAGFAEAGQSLDVLTTILNAYGMESGEVNKVSDMLVQTQNKGKTTVAELSTVMGKIIPTANATGVSLEQLTAGYAIMTSKGIAAAETTTYMSAMFNELSKTGSTTDLALRRISGKSFTELMESGVSVADVLEMLDKSAKENNETLKDMFGSAEAGKAALTLLGDGAKTFNGMVVEMQNSVGATDEAFNKVTDTVNERFNKSLNKAKNFAIGLYDSIKPVIISLIDMVEWLGENETALKLIGTAIGTVTALVIAFNVQQYLLASGLTLWSAIAGIATTITTGLGVAFAFLTSPIGLIILAIGALIAIGVLLYKNWDTVKAKAAELWDGIKITFENIKIKISELWKEAIQWGENVVKGIAQGFVNMGSWIKEQVLGFCRKIGDTVKGFFGISSPSKLMQMYGEYIAQGLANGIEGKTEEVVKKTEEMVLALKGALEKIGFKEISEAVDTSLVSLAEWVDKVSALGKESASIAKGLSSKNKNSVYESAMVLALSQEWNKTGTIKLGQASKEVHVHIENNGTVVGTNGMEELASTVSKSIAGQYGLATGGGY